MNRVVERALFIWALRDAAATLIAQRENTVYKITSPAGVHALRLHRQGYRTDAELWSELQWMAALNVGGLGVPAPRASLSGKMVEMIQGVQADVLNWLPGDTLDVVLARQTGKDRAALFHRFGRCMARLHLVTDGWKRPDGFVRCAWDLDGLLGDAPLWDRFWENPDLSPQDRALFTALRDKARADLSARSGGLDYGLIHADLVPSNVMVDGQTIQFIDFDDSGFGFRVFEIATALLKHLDAPDFAALKQALVDGYTSMRPIDLASLDLFMVLRAATYVGWNITRMDEAGAVARNARFIAQARRLAIRYLAPQP